MSRSRAVDQCREQVGGEGVRGEGPRVTFGGRGARRLEVDASIMDDSVHPADAVHLIGEFPGLGCTAKVADDHPRGTGGKVPKRLRPPARAGVQDNVMACTHEDTGGGAAEPVGRAGDEVGRAGDEDTGLGMILPPMACWYRSAALGNGLRIGLPPSEVGLRASDSSRDSVLTEMPVAAGTLVPRPRRQEAGQHCAQTERHLVPAATPAGQPQPTAPQGEPPRLAACRRPRGR